MCNLVLLVTCTRVAAAHVPSGGWGSLSGGRVDAGPRGALSPRVGPGGPAKGAAWGTSGSCLRPFRLLGQQGAASSYVETPTWKSRRALDQGSRGHVGEVLDMHPPGSGAENIAPGQKAACQHIGQHCAVNRPLDSSVAPICDVVSPRASIALTGTDLASRAPLRVAHSW